MMGTFNIQSKEVLMQVMEAIIRMKKQNRPTRGIAEIWYILKKNDFTGKTEALP